jgi:hypothetical protein
MSKVVVMVSGGIGKNVAFTAVLRCLSKSLNQKISVVTGWPLVYHGNPYIDDVWQFGYTDHFYQLYHKDTKFFNVEPYIHHEYISKKRHLLDVWCEQLGVEYDGGLPELFLFRNELRMAKDFIEQQDKPVLIAQFWGGPVVEQKQFEETLASSQRRYIPIKTAQSIVDELKDDYHIMLIADEKQQFLKGVTPLVDQLRVVMAAIQYADKLLLIDSFAQHVAAAFNKPATVLWSGTSPDVLGYAIHDNIRKQACPTPECHRPCSYLFDTLAGGIQWSCPNSDACIFHDVDAIVKDLKPDSVRPSLLEVKTVEMEPNRS